AVITEATVRTMSWSVFPWAASFIVSILMFFCRRPVLHRWWPDPRKVHLYRTLAAVCSVLLAGNLSLVWLLPSSSAALFWLSIAAPFALLTAGIAALSGGNGSHSVPQTSGGKVRTLRAAIRALSRNGSHKTDPPPAWTPG